MFAPTISPPHTYAEWVSILDMLKSKTNDEEVLQAMLQGTVEWQSGVAERFSKKLIDVVNYRMNSATDKFQTEMTRSRGQERAIVQALLALRKELRFLSKAIDLPALPDANRQHYHQLVVSQANSIQSSLEDSAKTDHSGKLASIVRNNRVNAF
ncbi:MAG: hypothetical protein LUJ09_00465 [Firmicutes bacterium]|nr:hypothetical protein [Bacillota bacterium]